MPIKYRIKTLIPYLQPICSQNIPHTFSLLAAIHLFTRSVTKSKISTSPVKKLVTATSCVYHFIQLITANKPFTNKKSTLIWGANFLFYFYFSANFFKFLLDVFCFVFCSAFFKWLWSSVYEILSFFKSKTCNFSYNLDNFDFFCAS